MRVVNFRMAHDREALCDRHDVGRSDRNATGGLAEQRANVRELISPGRIGIARLLAPLHAAADRMRKTQTSPVGDEENT